MTTSAEGPQAAPWGQPAAPQPGQQPWSTEQPWLGQAPWPVGQHPTGWYPAPRPVAPRLRTAATLVQVAFAGLVLVQIGFVWAVASRYQLLGRIAADPGSVTYADADASDNRVSVWAVASLVLLVTVAAAWLVWFYRARVAAEAFSDDVRFGRGWAIGSWFVPFLNLVRPYQMTSDIHDAVSPPDAAADRAHRRANVLIGCWWALFILSGVLDRFSFIGGSGSVASLRQHALLDIVSSGLDVVAAVLAVLVVQRITSSSDARRDAGAG